MNAPPHTLLDLGDGPVAYRALGSGPDLIFVHGWPLHSGTWNAVAERLSTDYRCHLIDLPGAGASPLGERPIGIREHAATIIAAADALGLTRYALVAHDSGGGVSRHVALRDDRVAGLVLGNTEIPNRHSLILRLLVYMAKLPGHTAMLRALMAFGPLRRSRMVGFGSCFRDLHQVDGAFYQQSIQPLLQSKDALDGAAELLRRFELGAIDELERRHGEIRCPTRLIWGTDDTVFPLRHARPMAEQFGGDVDLVEIEGGRCFAHQEFPDQFAHHAADHLRRCSLRS